MKRHYVVVTNEQGTAQLHPLKKWIKEHPNVPGRSEGTSHQFRAALKNIGWIVQELEDQVLVIQPDSQPALAYANELLRKPVTDDEAEKALFPRRAVVAPAAPVAGLGVARRSAHTMKPRNQSNNQVVGNVGLFYVCYRLSRFGWNVMPTARNARGIDIIIYSQDAARTHTIQVKALSQRSPVPLGGKLDGLLGDFFVICRNVALDTPECFVLTPAEVRDLAHKGEKDGKTSYWLQPKQYETLQFHDKWDRIGKGSTITLPDNEASA